MNEAPACVLGTCLTVVTTANMTTLQDIDPGIDRSKLREYIGASL
jgi:hypothetical protein